MSFLDDLDDRINKASNALDSAYNTANNKLNTTKYAQNHFRYIEKQRRLVYNIIKSK